MGCSSRSSRRAVGLEELDEVCSVAVAEEFQAVEEASRKKSQAGNQPSSEMSAPGPGTVWVLSPQGCHVSKNIPFPTLPSESEPKLCSFGRPSCFNLVEFSLIVVRKSLEIFFKNSFMVKDRGSAFS